MDTEISKQILKITQKRGGRLISWLLTELKRVEELNQGLTNTNPCIGRMEDQGLPSIIISYHEPFDQICPGVNANEIEIAYNNHH